VVWRRNDDRVPLRELYNDFADSGRVVLIADASCEELKGYIARLRFFVGARTHATIAAYSSLVPTLALGYSVKARGIALDLFGTEENYVVPVQSLKSETDLVAAFDWLRENEADIRKHLGEIMPEYVGRVQGIKEVVEGIL
jgi:polysaccharide pyruvyl transferase WcaK-like protein